MGKKLNKNVKIIYEMKDGRTSIVEGKIFSTRNKNSLIVRVFKRIVFSLNRKKYDLVEVTSSTIKILRKSIQDINPIGHEFNLATEGFDDEY